MKDKKDKSNVVKAVFLFLAIAFFIAEAATFYWAMIYSSNGLARLRIEPYEEFAAVRTHIFGLDHELQKLRGELEPVINPQDDDFSKALAICTWVMNQVKAEGGGYLAASNRTPYSILTAMRQGNTASCGYRALLYVGALKSMNLEARMLTLIKPDTQFTHATVEVLIGDDWIVIDPTFNVHFTIDGKLASAAELHRFLLSNGRDFRVEEGYEAISSSPYDGPHDLLEYFRHVSIYERRHFFAWQALPILQYFFGVSDVVLEDSHIIDPDTVTKRNLMSLAYNFIFPIGFGISFIAFVAISRRKRQLVNKNRTGFD
jgi:hypothetical protein